MRNLLVILRGAMLVYEKLGMEGKVKECRREMEKIAEAVNRGDIT